MGQDPRTDGAPSVAIASDPEQIRRQIDQTRLELGDTVAALAVKADVKAQARERGNAALAWGREHQKQMIGAGAALAGLLLLRFVRQ
jgi:hypothetical protein